MYFPELVFVQNTLCSAHSHRIRWQMMRDLTGEPADVAAAGRSRIANEGARLLALPAIVNRSTTKCGPHCSMMSVSACGAPSVVPADDDPPLEIR